MDAGHTKMMENILKHEFDAWTPTHSQCSRIKLTSHHQLQAISMLNFLKTKPDFKYSLLHNHDIYECFATD